MTFHDKVIGQLPPGADDWTHDELRDYYNEANLTDDQRDYFIDYFSAYDADDVQSDDFWKFTHSWLFGYTEEYSCDNPRFDFIDYLTWNIAPAFWIIIFLSFWQPRKTMCPGCCGKRPGIAFPVNLVDSYDDRLPIACAFAVTSTCILDLFGGSFYYQPDVSDIPPMLSGTIQVLICFVNVIEVCLVYYPLLLCLSTPASLFGNLIGFMYTANWTFFYIIRFIDCPVDSGVIGELYAEILGPVYICYWILLVRFALGFFEDVRVWYRSFKDTKIMDVTLSNSSIVPITDRTEDNDPVFCAFSKSHYYKYVLTLLKKPAYEENTESRCRRYLSKVYKVVPYFKYSTRFISTFVLSVLTLHQIGILYTYAVKKELDNLYKELFNDTYIPDDDFTRPPLNDEYGKELFGVLSDSFYVTSWISYTIGMLSLVHSLVVYRRNSLLLYKGDRSSFPQQYSNPSIVVASMRYSGYQIGYTLWEFFIFQITSWAVVFLVYLSIILPLRDGYDSIVLTIIRDYWLTLVIGYAFFYGQVFAIKYCCLQEKGKVLGLDNRRWFHVATYTLFFFHVITGLVSCLLRILKSVIFGALFIGRIDRCVLMRGFELWDSGYKAYFGFVNLEVAHTHPVLVTFCHILWSTTRRRQRESIATDGDPSEKSDDDVCLSVIRSRSKVARNRWFVALTLMRNQHVFVNRTPLLPELEQIRNEKKQEDERNGKSMVSVANDVLDSVATATVIAMTGGE